MEAKPEKLTRQAMTFTKEHFDWELSSADLDRLSPLFGILISDSIEELTRDRKRITHYLFEYDEIYWRIASNNSCAHRVHDWSDFRSRTCQNNSTRQAVFDQLDASERLEKSASSLLTLIWPNESIAHRGARSFILQHLSPAAIERAFSKKTVSGLQSDSRLLQSKIFRDFARHINSLES